jgi:hypothetical protein
MDLPGLFPTNTRGTLTYCSPRYHRFEGRKNVLMDGWMTRKGCRGRKKLTILHGRKLGHDQTPLPMPPMRVTCVVIVMFRSRPCVMRDSQYLLPEVCMQLRFQSSDVRTVYTFPWKMWSNSGHSNHEAMRGSQLEIDTVRQRRSCVRQGEFCCVSRSARSLQCPAQMSPAHTSSLARCRAKLQEYIFAVNRLEDSARSTKRLYS